MIILTVFPVGVRDMCTFPVFTAELPSVEGALEAVAADYSTCRHIGPVVWTIGVDDVGATVLRSEHRQLFTCDNIWSDSITQTYCTTCCTTSSWVTDHQQFGTQN